MVSTRLTSPLSVTSMIGIEGAVLYVNFYKLYLHVVSKNVLRYIFSMHTRFCRFYMIYVFFVVGSLQIWTNTKLTKLSYLSRYWYKLLKPANSGVAAPSPGFLIPKDGATLLIRAGRSKSLELAILCLAMYLGSIGWESNVHTVDGQNPAPPRMMIIPFFVGF